MRIHKDKALLLRVRNPQRITTLIPKSKLLPSGEVAVNWGIEEAQVLKNIGIKKVPSPITAKYDWPGLYKPFDHQRVTAEFLTLHKRAFCFNEQGTSKTASAIWAADYLMTIGEVSRVLIICPLSIMETAWRGDMFQTAMHRRVDIAHGNAKKRKAVIESDAEFVITNYETVVNSLDLLKYAGFDLIIVDEASAYKTATTKRWKALRALIGPDTWLWMMTGTPAAQSPVDAYGLAKLVNPENTPKFFSAFRDMVMNKITQFRYVPKPEAKQIVHEVLQPAIRFEKKDCLDLPPVIHVSRKVELTPQQKKYYDILKKKMVMQAAGEQVTAANAAVKLSKLLQVSCISEGTPVMTDRGWVPIETVTADDRVWDGEEWVDQKGAIYKGNKPVVTLDGVQMTADHKVWVGKWVTAQEVIDGDAGGRFERPDVRLPNSVVPGAGTENEDQNSTVGMSMQVREHSYPSKPIPTHRAQDDSAQLRVLPRQSKTSDEQVSPVQRVVGYEAEVYSTNRQRLEKLWREGYSGLQQVAGIVREFLGRHAGGLLVRANSGQSRRERQLRTIKLPVGYSDGAGQQHPMQRTNTNPEGGNDCGGSSESVRAEAGNFVRTTESVQVAAGRRTAQTFDLRQCGPRSRFVVKGEDGQLLIVHNCGSIYSDDGETVQFDITNRYKVLMEIIAETENKVLIFVPFTSTIDHLHERLAADGVTNDVINGKVPAGKRADIIRAFQNQDDPRVLVIQPQAAAHGVTLTAADTVVWWGPTASVEIFEQANARVDRPGQKNKCTVFKLFGSHAEWHVYNLLETKRNTHASIVDLYKKVLD